MNIKTFLNGMLMGRLNYSFSKKKVGKEKNILLKCGKANFRSCLFGIVRPREESLYEY
ncbi:MAG: hypothetical protein ACI83O_000250 [Patescibacteria group bacterium]|jgi:hypothetical protein